MKFWVLLLWLLLLHPLISNAQDCSEQGALRLEGRAGGNIRAGRLELCNGTEWKNVCEKGWDLWDAQVACRQLGFPEGGVDFFRYAWRREGGLEWFRCQENDMRRLIDCWHAPTDPQYGCVLAGVACRIIINETQTTTLAVSTVTREITQTVTETDQCTQVVPLAPCTVTPLAAAAKISQNTPQDRDGCSALVRGLGGLTVVMTLGLVIVVLAWVWLHYRKIRMSAIKKGIVSDTPISPSQSDIASSTDYMPTSHKIEENEENIPTYYDIIKTGGPPAEREGNLEGGGGRRIP